MKIALIAFLGLTINHLQAGTLTSDTANKLMTKSGCMTCHSQDTTKIGPSYKEVSNRYNNLTPETLAYLKGEKPFDYLMKKVRTGTKIGVNKNWMKSKEGKTYGMMTPNPPTRISDADLKDLITYILALK
ncbi:MAG: c-type cytochrome [Bacteriovoracaceae bacterium]|nr:c-type cytochrome [Bacteriovoracaceae bacterium]